MDAVKFKLINLEEAYEAFRDDPMPHGWSEEYLRTRPRILTDVDIFCKNIRSKKQKMKDFSLFEKTEQDGPDVVYVFSIYLELFEYHHKFGHILRSIDYFSKKYKDNLVLFQWNHDQDYAKYGKAIEAYDNVKVINFGYTSIRFKNSITVPFWNVNTTKYKEEKKVFASFYGSPNNPLRRTLVNKIQAQADADIVHASSIPTERFYKKLSESVFSMCPRGGPCDGGFSYRFFECMHLNTIPVLFVDKLVFPYSDELDWSKLCIRLPEVLVSSLTQVKRILKQNEIHVEEMLKYIEEKRDYFSLLGVQREVYKSIKKHQHGMPKVIESKIALNKDESVTIVNPSNIYGCTLEKDVFVGPFCEIQSDVTIGERTRVSSHSFICSNVRIGQDCFIAHGVMFINDVFSSSDGYEDFKENEAELTKETIVGDNVRIGSNATIMPVTIGANAIIGAGSVVTKNVPEGAVVYGNPAKTVKPNE